MRSLVPFSPARGWSWSALGALVMVFGFATPSSAALENSMFPGLLSVHIGSNPPVTAALDAPVVPTATRDGSNQLTKIGFAGGIFATTGLVVDVTDPDAAPISGIAATGSNAAANFTRSGTKFGGLMPLNGVNKVCLFGECATAPGNLTVPIDVVGGPAAPPDATVYATNSGIAITVKGAPWTQGAVTLGTADGGTEMQTGNFTNATQTTMGSSYKNVVELVTPIFVSTNIGASAVVPVYGRLTFTVNSPEPGTIAALGAAVISLVAMGIARRR